MPKAKRANSRKCGFKSPYYSCQHKDKNVINSVRSANGIKTRQSANLKWFLKVYKGLEDWHKPIFKKVANFTKAQHVLYPGSDKHITASLYFPSIVYVDINKKVEGIFHDEQILAWVDENKNYSQNTKITFLCKNFESTFEKEATFDLMISACAGIVSAPCSKYLKPQGYFLVSDAHFDARTTYLRPDFKLVGVYDTEKGKLETSVVELAEHFQTTHGVPINKQQVDESTEKPKGRRSFKLKKEAMFYLFQKTH